MTTMQIAQSIQYVVDHDGKPTAVVLDVETWQALLMRLEQVEDMALIRERLTNWRSKEGWTSWEEFEAELESATS